MADITLKHLRYFEVVAQHCHFGHAAEVCAVSQPALSVQIKALEEALGTPLFERGPRHVRLTPLGEALVPQVRAILQSVSDLEDAAKAWRGGSAPRLRLGIIPTMAPYLLPNLLATLSLEHPGLRVEVRESRTSQLVEELQDGRLDAAILALPVQDPKLEAVALWSEPFMFVRPAAQAGLPVPDAEALREMHVLLLEEGHCLRDQALSFCETSPSGMRDLLEASSLTTLVQMVSSGMGVTLIPQMSVAIETRSARVEVLPFPDPPPSRTVGMIWRRSTTMADQLQQIAALIAGRLRP